MYNMSTGTEVHMESACTYFNWYETPVIVCHCLETWLQYEGLYYYFVLCRCFVERLSLASAVWTSTSVISLMVFVIFLVIFYSLMPFVLKASGAVVVNLSLLTADIFTLVFGIFLFKFHVSYAYTLHVYMHTSSNKSSKYTTYTATTTATHVLQCNR